ncbi:PC-esterase domain-containing protein 1A [Dromiciops gliroides]|uniref:PC-esterase domain-containing protein 1A n=1 Tax=Dromiciops gliroides TaxID=33562 RepID=UPI001CC41962|nr:PC-esterase domain-containing protein 1A [Dromiciops gliroides]XP_043828542.1 PC-esterase domain-containing protein 1A [Dromiciops gliroides]XP_043828543.1 PC-esterase domain-containing protein 1A [Dromiciops gliroides]XP_043828544.1 PC-esterase domain-containing protein 1A [Dromiciops gliroides]XP_043828546.1 PC-esterase domain-containing protein 1A [Dromiciops gliroides]
MVHFLSSEVRQLLHNKFVVVLGDSIQRAVYKDLVLLLQKDSLLTEAQLKAKGELSFEQDRLVAGGQLGELHNGTHYREVRQFLSSSGHHLLRFYFLTRVYSAYVEDVLAELEHGPPPDLVIINSCLWDLSRYGGDAIRSYQENLECLFERMEQVLPASCLLVWTLAMPLGERITGGFLLPELQSMTGSLRADVVEANFYCSMLADGHRFDVLDLHFHFRHAVRHRRLDGIHWDQHAHRHLSQLLLAHVAEAWGVEAPRRRTPLGEWSEEQSCPEHPGQRSKGTWRHPAPPPEGNSPWRHPAPPAEEPYSWNQSRTEWSLEPPVQGSEEPASWRCSSQRTNGSLSFEPVAQETEQPLNWLDRRLQPQFRPSPQPLPLSVPLPLPVPSPQVLPQDSCFFSDNPVLPGYVPLNYIAFSDPLPPPAAMDSTPVPRPLAPSLPHYGQRHNLVMRRAQRHVPNGPYSRSREGGLSRQWSRPGHAR